MLVFSVCGTASLAMYLRKEYQTAYHDEWDKPDPDPDAVAKKYNFCISVVIAILAFCATLTVGMLILWIFAEWWVWPRQVRLNRMWHMLHHHRIRIELEQLREAAAEHAREREAAREQARGQEEQSPGASRNQEENLNTRPLDSSISVN